MYAVIIAVWCLSSFWFGWKNVLAVQNYILAVALVFMTDLFLRFTSLNAYNEFDSPSSIYTIFLVVVQGLGSTLSLYLLLLVSLGYGIVQ